MKLVKKEFIDNTTRIVNILGLNIKYNKTFDEKKDLPIYNVEFCGLHFSFSKKPHWHKQKSISHITKENKEDALLCTKCLNNFYSKRSSIETMVLGASTARCSYIEDEKSINFGIDAQDLYYSNQMLRKFDYQAQNLKNVVLYYDVFSAGNDMDISPWQKHRCAFYKTFFDIPYKNKFLSIKNDVVKLEEKLYTLKDYIIKNFDNIPKDYIPIMQSGFMTDRKLKGWVDAEAKLANKPTMLAYLREILREIKGRNYKLYIVLSPRNPRSKGIYPPKDILFESLYNELKTSGCNYEIIDTFFGKLEEDDFVDLLHLNPKGAKKITKIINTKIYGE